MTEEVYMECGHKANATCEGKPCCVICAPSKESMTPTEKPDLTGRKCKCVHCGKIVPSTEHIAFFEHRPNEEYDDHYDGCWGWD